MFYKLYVQYNYPVFAKNAAKVGNNHLFTKHFAIKMQKKSSASGLTFLQATEPMQTSGTLKPSGLRV